MNTLKKITIVVISAILFVSCANHEAKNYGPVEFEIPIEGPLFVESLAEGVVTIPFKPEDFGITRDEVQGMKLDQIELASDHPDGLGIFNNVVFTIMTDNTESKDVASQKIKGSPKRLIIKGLDEAEIEGFSQTDKFYLEMTGISRKDVADNVTLKGRITLRVLVGN